jgi:hypothetical protein
MVQYPYGVLSLPRLNYQAGLVTRKGTVELKLSKALFQVECSSARPLRPLTLSLFNKRLYCYPTFLGFVQFHSIYAIITPPVIFEHLGWGL